MDGRHVLRDRREALEGDPHVREVPEPNRALEVFIEHLPRTVVKVRGRELDVDPDHDAVGVDILVHDKVPVIGGVGGARNGEHAAHIGA